MRQLSRYILATTALFLFIAGARADQTVIVTTLADGLPSDQAGMVDYQMANGVCTLTVKPSKDYFITSDDITVMKVLSGDLAQARRKTPSMGTAIALTATAVNTYTFEMPDAEYDVEVTANFQSDAQHPGLGIRVMNTVLTEARKAYPIGGGTVSFDPETSTLTLNNVAISGVDCGVRSSVGTLTVLLLGRNTISTSGSAIESTVATNVSNLFFTTQEDQAGELTLSCVNEDYNFTRDMFPMFKANYENGLKRYEEVVDGEKTGSFIVGIPPLVYQTPEIEANNGRCCFDDQPVEIRVSANAEKFDIFYTLDDSAPIRYDAPFTLPAGRHTLAAYTVKKGAGADAAEHSETAVLQLAVFARPVFNPSSGYYASTQQVGITRLPDAPAQVWYFKNDNRADSVQYQPGTMILIEESTTLTAYIVDTDGDQIVARTDTVMATYQLPATYDIWVQASTGGVSGVTEANKADVLGDGRVSYDSNARTLTLKGAALAGITSHRTDLLTIDLQGVNTLTGSIALEKNTGGKLRFATTTGTGLLKVSAAGSVLSGFSEETFDDGLSLLTPGKAVRNESGEYHYLLNGEAVSSATVAVATPYELWIDGTQVTDVNKADVLADGKVSYDAAQQRLSLNGAHIGESFIGKDHAGIECYDTTGKGLTIMFSGNNSVDATATPAVYSPAADKKLKLIFKCSDDAENMLVLSTGSEAMGVFGNVSGKTYENATVTEETMTSVTLLSCVSYDLWIGDVQVTSLNRKNLLNDQKRASVSFISENTLVLNDATLEAKPIKTALDTLHIILIGESVLTSKTGSSLIQAEGNGKTVVFNTSPNNYGSMKLKTSGSYLSGFAENGILYENGLTSQLNGDEMTIWRNVPITPILDEKDEGADGQAPASSLNFDPQSFVTTDEQTGEVEKKDLSNITVGNALITLSDVQQDGQTVETGSFEEAKTEGGVQKEPAGIVLKYSLTDDEVIEASRVTPGSEEYADKFKGITFEIPGGKGYVYIYAIVTAGARLNVKIGDNDPLSFPEEGRVLNDGEPIIIPYESDEPQYVQVYHGGVASGNSRRDIFREKVERIHIKVTGLGATASSLVQVNYPDESLNQTDQVRAYTLGTENYVNSFGSTGIVISHVCGKPVTWLSSSLFDDVADKLAVDYIDLHESGVQNLFAPMASRQMRTRRKVPAPNSRLNGLLNGFDARTLVFLPAGNEGSTESNIVVDGVCNRLELIDGKAFLTPYDFRARELTFDRVFKDGQATTLFLPCSIPEEQSAALGTFHRFSGIADGKAVFAPAEEGDIDANTPFVFVPAASGVLPMLNRVAVSSLVGNDGSESEKMYGTYRTIAWDIDHADIYCQAEQDNDTENANVPFVRMTQGMQVTPFRAYIKSASSLSSLPIAVSNGQGGDITGISNVNEQDTSCQQHNKGVVYNLNGQVVTHPRKGSLYIVDGRKVVMQ